MPITFDIPEDILGAIPGNAADVEARLRLELACALYQRELASFGSAARVAGMHPFAFGHELTRRGITRHYGEAEMAEDAAYVARHQ
jgi:predicted HTH domain antitoxin